MSRTLSLIAIALLAMLLAAPAFAQEAPANLIKNPGVETLEEGKPLPADWAVSTWSVEKGQRLAELELTDDAHSGKKAVKIRYFGGSRNIVVLPKLTETCDGKSAYRFTCWVKGEGKAQVWASALTSNAATGKQLDYVHTKKRLTPQDKWQQMTFDFTTSEESKNLYVYIRVTDDGIIVDDAALVRLPSAAE